MINSRGYTDDDLAQIQVALASWIQEAGDCGYCHVGELPYYIYNRLCGKSQSELVQIWEDDAGIAGISISHFWDNAFAVYSSPKYRGTDGEITMLQDAADRTRKSKKQHGSKETAVIIDVWDKDEIRKAQLEKIDFKYYRVWGHNRERRLDEAIPEAQLPDGYSVRSCTLDDAALYITAYNSAFGGSWEADKYRACVMAQPGYYPENVKVVIAPDGRAASFTILWYDAVNHAGLFEPVGTHQDFHRRGLARNLMLHCLHEMKARGMQTALIGHDAENQAALKLYEQLGFEKKYETQGYERK